jgi:hypothetical protein
VKSYSSISSKVRVACVVLLLLALLDLPYVYYNFLRFAICGTAAYLSYLSATLKRPALFVTLGMIALTFNPFFMVRFDRIEWASLDVDVAVIFLWSCLYVGENMPPKAKLSTSHVIDPAGHVIDNDALTDEEYAKKYREQDRKRERGIISLSELEPRDEGKDFVETYLGLIFVVSIVFGLINNFVLHFDIIPRVHPLWWGCSAFLVIVFFGDVLSRAYVLSRRKKKNLESHA